MFTVHQHNFGGIPMQIGCKHAAQWRSPLRVPVGHAPDVNLVIAQMLCYVGKRLSV